MIPALLALALPAVATTAADPLWNAAVAAVGKDLILPKAAIVSTAAQGRTTETWVTFQWTDDHLESTIVYRREGNRVLSEEECSRRNRLDTRLRRAAPFRIDEIPLQPALQPIVRHRRAATVPEGVVFEFAMHRDGDALVGTVFVAHDGTPRRIEFEPRPMPFGIRSIHSSLRLEPATGGGVRLHSMTVTGSAGALWIDRPFRTEYRFLDQLPEMPRN
ncbi:MAG TPA: hypothetical protein VM779_14175 [Thermoanaerobaculia bacterium]|nr:hypothetical protein [Thermoanaerobaculia bacterium]